jgi:acyl-coenzyme A thioesterase 9
MFGIRRSALARSKCLASKLPARTAVAAKPSCINAQSFHSTTAQAGSRATWMPMRVKTPWIDALTQSREAQKADAQQSGQQNIKPDLTPKKMSDSYYSAVRTSRSD